MRLPFSEGEVFRGMHVEAEPLRVGRVAFAMPSEELAGSTPLDEAVPAIEAERRAAREAGEQAGYAEGLRRGRAEAALATEAALQKAVAEAAAPLAAKGERLTALLTSLEVTRKELLQLAEEDIVALCFETVCRIVGETALELDTVRARLQRLVAQCTDHPQVALHVHPGDLELLRSTSALQHFHWVADRAVALGGCIVRKPGDSLDARLETALAACRDTLLATRASRAAAEQGA